MGKRIPAEEPECQLQLFRRMQQALGTPTCTLENPWPTWAYLDQSANPGQPQPTSDTPRNSSGVRV